MIRLAYFSDSPCAGSGFGTVARNILHGLHATGDYEIHCLGVGHPLYMRQDPILYPYPIYPHPTGYPQQGQDNLKAWLEYIQPDVLVVNEDVYRTFYLTHPEFMPHRRFPIIYYQPLDSTSADGLIPYKWRECVLRQDWTVLYQDWAKEVFAKAVPQAADRMSVIPHGVDTSLFCPGVGTRVMPENIVVGMVGKNQMRKDYPSFLAAMQMVVADCPEAAIYLHTSWVGNVSWDIEELVRAYGLTDHILEIEFAGRTMAAGHGISLPELVSVYQTLDIHVLAHQGEGWGLPHCEAMASGVPSLATDYAGTRENCFWDWQRLPVEFERVSHPGLPLLRPHTDVRAMATKILDLCKQSREERHTLGLDCREKVASQTWERTIPMWHDLIEQVVGRYGGGSVASAERRRVRVKRGWKVGKEEVEDLAMPGAYKWPTVGVVIPAYNTPVMLERCLNGIETTDYAGEVQTCIIDNGSDPPIWDQFPEERKPLFIERLEEPVGFAAAVNVGFKVLQAWRGDLAYVVLMNQDCEVLPDHTDWLTHLINWMEQRPQCAVAGAKLLFSDGTLQHAGNEVPKGGVGAHRFYRKPANLPEANFYEKVQSVTGAVYCIRRTALEELGYFDEGYTLGCEETDFSLRAAAHGWEVWYVPDSVVLHHEHGVRQANPQDAARIRKWNVESDRRFRDKWGDFCDLCADGSAVVVVDAWNPVTAECKVAQEIEERFNNAGLETSICLLDEIDAGEVGTNPLPLSCSILIATSPGSVMATRQVKAGRKFYVVDSVVEGAGSSAERQAALASYYQMEYEMVATNAKVAKQLEEMGRQVVVCKDVHDYLVVMAGVRE